MKTVYQKILVDGVEFKLADYQIQQIEDMEKMYGTKRRVKWDVLYCDKRVDDGDFEDTYRSYDTKEEAEERCAIQNKIDGSKYVKYWVKPVISIPTNR